MNRKRTRHSNSSWEEPQQQFTSWNMAPYNYGGIPGNYASQQVQESRYPPPMPPSYYPPNVYFGHSAYDNPAINHNYPAGHHPSWPYDYSGMSPYYRPPNSLPMQQYRSFPSHGYHSLTFPSAPQHDQERTQQRSSKEEIIRELEENRLRVEVPCRTLFVRNLGFKADGRKIGASFSKFGPIRDVADLIDKRGLMFISFYDIRHAESALDNLHGAVVESRKLDVHYSLPKQDVDVQGPCSKDHNQGTLLVQLAGARSGVTSSDLERLVRIHGDVRRIRDFKNNDMKKYFEFYDSRDCVKAFTSLQNSVFNDGKITVEYAWDLPESMRLAQASLRGDPLKEFHKSSQNNTKREYDRYMPHQPSHRAIRQSHPPSPPLKPAKKDPVDEPILFEDKVGKHRLVDPRRRSSENSTLNVQFQNEASPKDGALFEQMSNLLTILNQPKHSSSHASSGPNNAEAVQQLAQLLIDQKKENNV